MKRFTKGCEKEVLDAHIYWRHVLDQNEKNKLLKNSNYKSTEHLFEQILKESYKIVTRL